jgi:ribosomal protein S18 acetylase RimI-like enzyme
MIRMAGPRDAEFLAWAILTASRGHLPKGWFDIALARSETECLEFLKRLTTSSTRSWWHYSRFFVAEADAHPVAALCAFRAGDAYPLSQAALTETAEALGFTREEQTALWQRGSYLFTCTTATNADAWTIDNVATLPHDRRQGHTASLLAVALEAGRTRRIREAQITLCIGNDIAQRAYERIGFRPTDEQRHEDFAAATGAPGMRRLVRIL